MGKLLDLAFYNPTQLKDDDFLTGFVARQQLVAKILARLGEISPSNLAQHRLIVGQRGMGKTSLLRRIAIGVRDTPALAGVLLPLRFREEQYNVHNLHIFWCNCLDALADWLEAGGQAELADQLDREVAVLDSREDDSEGSAALALFKEWMKRQARRPLLLLDNIDLIFNGLKEKQWSLRRALQEAGGIVVIGASAGFLEAVAAPRAAFYDFFQVDVLERLSREALLASLRHLAAERGEAGRRVTALLARDPGRIHTLYDLTGGNPRTLVMLYLMLEVSDEDDLMRDLERLLDQVTPLYKARVEDLPAQSRVVFDAVALTWNPVTAAEVATVSGLETATVSTQLDRLLKDGILEKVALVTTSRAGFQVSERFFNIWYLMRHASRRQRSRLRWLAEFLRKFYSPQELGEMAGTIFRSGRDRLTRSAYCLALSDALDDPDLQNTLRYEAKLELERHVVETGISVETLAEPGELYVPQTAVDWYRQGVTLHLKLGAYDRAEAAYSQAIALDPQDASSWNALGYLLEACLHRFDEAEAAYRKAIALKPKASFAWSNLGDLLQDHLERFEEAEGAYRQAIALEPKAAFAWINLGNLLQNHMDRFEEAAEAYRQAIALTPKDAYCWSKLGYLLQWDLGRYQEAEAAYREAIALDPREAFFWIELGSLLQYPLWRLEEAEAAYRQAIKLDPNGAIPWSCLGNLLKTDLGRYEEAEAAYRQAISLDPQHLYSWIELGNLLQDHLGRAADAEFAYRQAIALDPNKGASLTGLAYFLLARADRRQEAEECYQEAIGKFPAPATGLLQAFHALAWDNFGKAAELFGTVLAEGFQKLFSTYREDLLRILRLAAQRGYGDKLLAWFDESGMADRYWPLYAAFDAFLHGEELLGEVNPEVRGAASRIHAWLASTGPVQERKAAVAPGRKKRVKRSKAVLP